MKDQNLQEIWQVDVNGEIYEADFESLAEWIAEGSLQPPDKVRRGNLPWREAETVRLLNEFFDAKKAKTDLPVLTTIGAADESENDFPAETESLTGLPEILHCDLPEQITRSKTESPQNAVKISNYSKPVREFNNSAAENFGFTDFVKVLAYPFKFKASLIFGAIFFTIFRLGQSVWVFGGFMLISAFFCLMLANTLTFGILANTVENFSQGKTEADFMPRFDDFSAWDDVIHPFLLSVGAYSVSFGLMFILLVGATWYAVDSLKEIDKGKDKIISAVLPVPPNDLNLVKQSEQVGKLTEQYNKKIKINEKNTTAENEIIQSQINSANQAAAFENIQKQIARQTQAETEKPDGNNSLSEMPANVMRLSLVFSIPIFLAFLWGVFYFPAACAVAAYTRSLTATLNPLIGFDTIKRLGFDYAKILALFLILGVFAVLTNSFFSLIFAPLDLPQIGNLAVKFVDGFLYFYISVVFSVVLGFVIYKNLRHLNLFHR